MLGTSDSLKQKRFIQFFITSYDLSFRPQKDNLKIETAYF